MQWWQEHRAVLWVIPVPFCCGLLVWSCSMSTWLPRCCSVTWNENSISCAWVQGPWGGSDCGDIPPMGRTWCWKEPCWVHYVSDCYACVCQGRQGYGCVFFTDNLVCCICPYQVMCWPRKQLSALYFEVTPCRWKYLPWILLGLREARKRKSLRPGSCLCVFGEVGKSEMWSLLSVFHQYYIVVYELISKV